LEKTINHPMSDYQAGTLRKTRKEIKKYLKRLRKSFIDLSTWAAKKANNEISKYKQELETAKEIQTAVKGINHDQRKYNEYCRKHIEFYKQYETKMYAPTITTFGYYTEGKEYYDSYKVQLSYTNNEKYNKDMDVLKMFKEKITKIDMPTNRLELLLNQVREALLSKGDTTVVVEYSAEDKGGRSQSNKVAIRIITEELLETYVPIGKGWKTQALNLLVNADFVHQKPIVGESDI